MSKIISTILLSAVTTVSTGATTAVNKAKQTFALVGSTSSGAGAATVNVEASNDGINWVVLAIIGLTLSTTAAVDGFAADAAWLYVRGRVTAISGTGAAVTLTMGSLT